MYFYFIAGRCKIFSEAGFIDKAEINNKMETIFGETAFQQPI